MARNAIAVEVPYTTEKMGAGEYTLMHKYDIATRSRDMNVIAGIWHGCPCGCGARSYLPIDTETGWTIVKPFPKASLTPSIGMFAGQSPFHWHGYLTDGEFREC